MDEKKTRILSQIFCNDLNVPHEGLIIVGQQGEQFHALPSGEPAYPERYECVEHFQNRRAWVKEKGGRWKRIDKNGKEVS